MDRLVDTLERYPFVAVIIAVLIVFVVVQVWLSLQGKGPQ